jgi:O-antigen ligase
VEGSPVDRAVFSVLIAIGVIILARRGSRIMPLLRDNLPILLYFGYCLISIAWSDYGFVAFKRWIRGVGDLVMVLVILTDRDWGLAFDQAIARVGFVLVPLSVLFIRFFPQWGRAYSRWDATVSWCGVTTSKNALGMICMLIGIGFAWRLLAAYRGARSKARTRQLFARGLLLALALWVGYLSNSATSIACLAVGGGVMYMASNPGFARNRALVHFLVIGALTVSIYALFFDSGGGMVGALGRKSTLTGRTNVWKRVLDFVESPIVGTGYESFWIGTRLEQMRRVDEDLNQAHNGYLEVYLNVGFVGLFFLALVIVNGYKQTVSLLRADPMMGSLRLGYIVVGLVYNCTEAAIKMRAPVWLFFLLASCAGAKASVSALQNRKRRPATISPPQPAFDPLGSLQFADGSLR